MPEVKPRPISGEVLEYLDGVSKRLHGIAQRPDKWELGKEELIDLNELAERVDQYIAKHKRIVS